MYVCVCVCHSSDGRASLRVGANNTGMLLLLQVVVIAEDSGQPNSRRSIATLVVEVTDRNDNDPMFEDVSWLL